MQNEPSWIGNYILFTVESKINSFLSPGDISKNAKAHGADVCRGIGNSGGYLQ